MRFLPVFQSWVVFIALVSIFLWRLSGVAVVVALVVFAVLYLLKELLNKEYHYVKGFLLFIGTEVIIFLTLFLTCL